MCSQLPSHSVCGHSTIVAWCVRVIQQSSSSSLQTTIVGPTKVAWCVPSFSPNCVGLGIKISRVIVARANPCIALIYRRFTPLRPLAVGKHTNSRFLLFFVRSVPLFRSLMLTAMLCLIFIGRSLGPYIF